MSFTSDELCGELLPLLPFLGWASIFVDVAVDEKYGVHVLARIQTLDAAHGRVMH